MSRKKPTPKRVTVISTQRISPNMQRVVLQGEALANFPEDCAASYVKFLFDGKGNTISEIAPDSRPIMRTYSIRRFMPETAAIEVDFVRHITQDPDSGFATRWADAAQVGDEISLMGPGAIASINNDADWFFMVADMTGLPALSAKLQTLPKQAIGYVVIKVTHQDDIQPLSLPSNMQATWITDEPLNKTVQALPWLDGSPFVWVASDFDSMRELRQYFRNDKNIPKDDIYISSYWKEGIAEDGHKVLKKQDAEAHE
ncbi:putative siderophore-interacting protein [Vibrio halioticoli NBRC 102217]|uniref:Putative siderophore-interacting protein n=1 Tax=Vibrio halioticoli NBRC 102217 TaxID=1219072 RepID=V5F5N1_9VIBR|nr:siderophore-interacting protein [Vibrio halioticoli]GAD90869.1 putative siderophore-interacting protein [Vibrio halioticoli NBRC 102217]